MSNNGKEVSLEAIGEKQPFNVTKASELVVQINRLPWAHVVYVRQDDELFTVGVQNKGFPAIARCKEVPQMYDERVILKRKSVSLTDSDSEEEGRVSSPLKTRRLAEQVEALDIGTRTLRDKVVAVLKLIGPSQVGDIIKRIRIDYPEEICDYKESWPSQVSALLHSKRNVEFIRSGRKYKYVWRLVPELQPAKQETQGIGMTREEKELRYQQLQLAYPGWQCDGCMHFNAPMTTICYKQAIGEGKVHVRPVDYEQRLPHWKEYDSLALSLRYREPLCYESRKQNTQGLEKDKEEAYEQAQAWTCRSPCWTLNGRFCLWCNNCGADAPEQNIRTQQKEQWVAHLNVKQEFEMSHREMPQGFKKAEKVIKEKLFNVSQDMIQLAETADEFGDDAEAQLIHDQKFTELCRQQNELQRHLLELKIRQREKLKERQEAVDNSNEGTSEPFVQSAPDSDSGPEDGFDPKREKTSLWCKIGNVAHRVRQRYRNVNIDLMAKRYKEAQKRPNWTAFFMGAIKGMAMSTSGVISVMTTAMLLPFLGPWCLMVGPLLGTGWYVTSPYLLNWMALLLALVGFQGVGYLFIGWTVLTMAVTASVTYATARVYAPSKGTIQEKKKQLEQDNQGIDISSIFESANMCARWCIPEGRTLQYIRNLMGIVKDLPTMVKMIGGFWRGLWFDLKNCHTAEAPTFSVYSRSDLRYNIVGLSETILVGQLTMVGHTLVYKDENNMWTSIEVSHVSDMPLSRCGKTLMCVDTLMYEDDKQLKGFMTATVENACFDTWKRCVVKRTGERMTYDSSLEDIRSRHVVEIDQATERERKAEKAYRAACLAKKSKNEKGLLSQAWRDEVNRVEALRQRHKDQIKVAKLAKKARMGAGPSKPVINAVPLSSVYQFGAAVPNTTFVPPRDENVAVAPASRDVGSVVPLKDQVGFTLDGISQLLDVESKDKEKESNQGPDETHIGRALAAGSELRTWINGKVRAVRPVWWCAVGLAILTTIAIGIVIYFARKQRRQAISKVIREEKQSTILKYDVDPGDMITKYEVDDHWFAYNPERMSTLAAGKQPGEIVPVNVVFSSGKARSINMVVSDDGMKLQNFAKSGWDSHAPTKVPDDLPKGERKELGRGVRRNVRRPVNGFVKRASAVMENQALLDSIAVNPDARKYIVKKHRLNLGLYNYERETRVTEDPTDRIWMAARSEASLVEAAAKMLKAQNQVNQGEAGENNPHPERMVREVTEYEKRVLSTSDVEKIIEDANSKKFPQASQAFRTIAAAKHVYAVYSKGENHGHVVKLRNGIWFPFHYQDGNTKMSDLRTGMQVQLVNPLGCERPQIIVWNEEAITRVKDMWDGAYMPLPFRYDHMARANNLQVVKDGIHMVWVHGLDPGTGTPFQIRVKATKVGNKWHYSMPNKAGICGATLSLDQSQLTQVGMHCTGNESSEECTASAVTRGLIELSTSQPEQGF